MKHDKSRQRGKGEPRNRGILQMRLALPMLTSSLLLSTLRSFLIHSLHLPSLSFFPRSFASAVHSLTPTPLLERLDPDIKETPSTLS